MRVDVGLCSLKTKMSKATSAVTRCPAQRRTVDSLTIDTMFAWAAHCRWMALIMYFHVVDVLVDSATSQKFVAQL